MARAIFISYRREDSEGEAGRLFDDLARTWGEDSVFMDVAGITPGADFRKAIDDNIATCGVLLAVIGPAWASIADGSGQRRLNDPNDFVRLEIASALRRQIPVIPVLVHEAKMPRPEQLPEDLRDLAFRNSVELSHTRWNSDVQLLTDALSQYLVGSGSGSAQPVHAVVPVQLPPAQAGESPAPPRKKTAVPMLVALAVLAFAVIAAAFLLIHRAAGPTGKVGSGPQPAAPVQPASGDGSGQGAVRPADATQALPEWVNAMQGTWANSAPVGNEVLNKLQIAVTDGQLTMHAWGLCQPSDCDWGSQKANLEGLQATATWQMPQTVRGQTYRRQLVISVTPDKRHLRVLTEGTLTSSSAPELHGHGKFKFVRVQ